MYAWQELPCRFGLVWFIVAAAEQAEVLRRTRLYLRCVVFDKVLTLYSLNLLLLILFRSNSGLVHGGVNKLSCHWPTSVFQLIRLVVWETAKICPKGEVCTRFIN